MSSFKILKTCPVCNSEFESYKSRNRVYCSPDCYWESKKGSTIPEEQKRKISKSLSGRNLPRDQIRKIGLANRKRTEVECSNCGAVVSATPSRLARSKKNIYCSYDCRNEHARGEDSLLWRGGYEGYGSDFSKELKAEIRERDGFCIMCGATGSSNGRALCVHHIDYDKLNCSPWNLIALCDADHNRTNHNREFWTEAFTVYCRREIRQDWQMRQVVL